MSARTMTWKACGATPPRSKLRGASVPSRRSPDQRQGVRWPNSRLGRRWWRLRRLSHHLLDHSPELLETSGRNDDRVPAPADIFGDPEKTAARIFLEREHKRLPFD